MSRARLWTPPPFERFLDPDPLPASDACQEPPVHPWEAMSYDASRAGCVVCGAERDASGLVRRPTETPFSRIVPVCKPIRNHYVPPNAENARRLLRVPDGCFPFPRKLKNGERCPDCGYGKSCSEGVRAAMDQAELETETKACATASVTLSGSEKVEHGTLIE